MKALFDFISDNGFDILIALCCLALMVFYVIAVRKVRKQKQNGQTYTPENELQNTTRKINATVVEQFCYVRSVGIKMPKTIREFVVVFKDENEGIVRLNVPEEIYDAFEEGQKGVLTLVNNELYSFELESAE